MAPTNVHTFRCSDSVWLAAKRKAKREHVSLSLVIAELLSMWVAVQETPVKGSD